MLSSTRRQFLQAATFSAAGLMFTSPVNAVQHRGASIRAIGGANSKRLDEEWEFHFGTIDVDAALRPSGKERWELVRLPHCFNALNECAPDRPYFRGQGWYRRRIVVDNPYPGGRTLLHFQGAGQTTSLWVGHTHVGTHIGGYDEFTCDITDAISQLQHVEHGEGVLLTILCDNTPDQERVPSDLSDFCLYGGLYRHVNLVYLPAIALDVVHILPVVNGDGSAQVAIKGRLYNPGAQSEQCTIAIEVTDPRGKLIHQSRRTMPTWKEFESLAKLRVSAPELWSPSMPNLYRCSVTLTTSAGEVQIEERFGIRHFEFVEHGAFKLNGRRLLLRGTHRHQDHAGVAAAMSDEQVREEMRMIREMGANFIRLAHYQQDRLVLDMCDELGLLVWEELPWCRAGVGDEAFQQNATRTLINLIEQHYNHPAIVFWGLGNEIDWPGEYPSLDENAIRAFMTRLRDLAHQLDNSRLTALRRCDFARDIPDVYSPSIWAGWYGGNYHEYEQSLLRQRERVAHFIHMEWGADSHAGRHSEDPETGLGKVPTNANTDERGLAYRKTGGTPRVSRDGDWSETYACNLFDWHLKTQEGLDWLSGTAQWAFKDFASPLRDENGIPRVNQKGVVERDLRKKESYYVFQSYWADKPMAHIYGHSWPTRWGKPEELRSVHVYSNCEHAELFLNGISQGTKRRNSQDFPSAGLRWSVAFAPGTNHLRVEARKGDVSVTDEINLFYQTEPWSTPAVLRLVERERSGDLVTVEVKLFDVNGVLCLDAMQFVRFSLTGPGQLIDNLGTTRGSRELQLANGRAQISLKVHGVCRVGAAVEGLPTAEIEV